MSERDRLRAVFKAYDVRGTVPDQLDAGLLRAVGGAFVEVTGETGVVVGHDMRPSSPSLAEAFAQGASEAGADVTRIGLASTDELYFASGSLDLAGAMVTASHNPAGYNGLKLCLPGARPVGADTGLNEIRDRVADGVSPRVERPGRVGDADLLAAYADHLVALAPVRGRRLSVVVDAGNGMAGLTTPAVFDLLRDVDLVPMYFELDGSFPHHEANPLEPDNLRDLQRRVVADGADLGLAFDGDADRCFVVDERGEPVSPSAVTGLIAARSLAAKPGATIIHNLITSRAVPELVGELGGRPVRTRVGHSYIKAKMAESGAVFGGEHSGHFYFRDFWCADSGMLAALHVLAAAAADERPVSELMATYERYVSSGEINSRVENAEGILQRLERAYVGRTDIVVDHLDGLSVQHPDWSFNVRPSNTEPLLRLNTEGRDRAVMEAVRNDVLAAIRRDS